MVYFQTMDPDPSAELPALQQISAPTQPGVTCRRIEGTLNPLIHTTDKDTKLGWLQH